MAAPSVSVREPGRLSAAAGRLLSRGVDQLVWMGNLVLFLAKAVAWIPYVLTRFRGEIARLLAEVSVGSGLLFVAGGSVGVIFMLSGAIGIEVGLEGFQGLHILGLAPLSGYVSAFANTRELAPLIAAVALASQLGCKFTAQLGAMRINEEIDAVEMMAVPPIPYLVTTRIIAAVVAVIPLYLVGLFAAYVGTEVTISVFFHQSAGTYGHYFHVFIQPRDVILSVVKVVVFALLVIPIHCYYGYYASGGRPRDPHRQRAHRRLRHAHDLPLLGHGADRGAVGMRRVNTESMTAEQAVAASAARRRALRRRTSVYGAGLLVAVLLVVGAIVRTFTSGGSSIAVTALVSRAGDALQNGDEVRFRNLIVGKVVGTGELQGDVTRLQLLVDPEQAAQIPAGVSARRAPWSPPTPARGPRRCRPRSPTSTPCSPPSTRPSSTSRSPTWRPP